MNNNVENLEWVTSKENSNYGTRNQKIREWALLHCICPPKRNVVVKKVVVKKKNTIGFGKMPRIVAQINKTTNEIIQIYPSTAEAKRQTGYSTGHISECCNGKKEYAYGYKWKYLN